MNTIATFPYTEAEFNNAGKLITAPAVPAGTTDLIVVSHGWNNDSDDAHKLYTKLFTNFANLTANDPALAQRRIAILGIIWPSKKFDDLMTEVEGAGESTGGAKSLPATDTKKAEKAMNTAIDRVAPLFDQPGDKARLTKLKSLKKLVPKLETDAAAQVQFVKVLRELLDRGKATKDQKHREDGSDVLFDGQPANIFANATRPAPAGGRGGAATARPKPRPGTGGAAGFRSFFSKAANAVTNLLNLTTYFEMKQRAGTVGKNGLAPLLDSLAGQVQRIHLAGHSFGGRVVTAGAANSKTNKLRSLSLLQAAFSHNGFSRKRSGFFRSVIDNKRIAGPILVTHTRNDTAVGLAYPAASRISGDVASAFGDANDKFGGIGSNGAQQMEVNEISAGATMLTDVKLPYVLEPGKIHNLKADAFIVNPKGGNAHSFVFVPQVAWAISRAMLG